MPTTTGYWIKVENGAAVQVWDSAPPAGESGWVEAIEIKPDLIPNQEILTDHMIDLTKTPAEIVYSKRSVTWQERKELLRERAILRFKAVEEEQNRRLKYEDPEFPFDAQALEDAKFLLSENLDKLLVAASHSDLDLLNLD
jgi:hypothetical protein